MGDNVKLVQRIYGSVGSGDIPGVIAGMADDVVIEVPGPSDIPFAGTYRGHDGVAAFFQAIGENAEIKGFEPREFHQTDAIAAAYR